MDSITVEEIKAIEKLRSMVTDILNEERLSNGQFLVRWLRARNWNIIEAEKMLRQSMQWRKDNDMDIFLTKYDIFDKSNELTKPVRHLIASQFTTESFALDQQGDLIFIYRCGTIDLNALSEVLDKQEYLTVLLYYAEKLVQMATDRSKKTGNQPTVSFLGDFDGLTFAKLVNNRQAIEVYLEGIKLLEKHQPEILKKCIMVNAPLSFQFLWKLARPLLHDNTANKIIVFGRNENEWKTYLLDHIDASELPEFYGGTKTDGTGDPKCPKLIAPGGTVPKEVVQFCKNRLQEVQDRRCLIVKQLPEQRNNNNNAATKTDFTGAKNSIVINRGSFENLEIPVSVPGSILRWNFTTECLDIAFALHLKKEGETVKTLVEKRRIDFRSDREEGELMCVETGTYILEFDNSHSKLRRKKVIYYVQVIQP